MNQILEISLDCDPELITLAERFIDNKDIIFKISGSLRNFNNG
jgi:hypothetical protein